MSNDDKSSSETKVELIPAATNAADLNRGAMLHKGAYTGVALGPQQQFLTPIQLMTPASPPPAPQLAAPKAADPAGDASNGEQ